jgi:autotransporter-associated beta strand protein
MKSPSCYAAVRLRGCRAVARSAAFLCVVSASDICEASILDAHGAVAVRSLRGEFDYQQGARAEGDPAVIEQAGIWTGNTFQSSTAFASANAASDRFLQASASATGVGDGLFVPAGEGQGVAVWRDIMTTDSSIKPSSLRLNFSVSSFLSAIKYPDAGLGYGVARIGVDWHPNADIGWWTYHGERIQDYAILQGLAEAGRSAGSLTLSVFERPTTNSYGQLVENRWDSYSFSPVPDGSMYWFEGTFHVDVPYSSEYDGYAWGLALSAVTYAKGGEAAVYPTNSNGPAGARLLSVSNRDIGPPLQVFFDSGMLPMYVPGFVAFNLADGFQTQEQAGYPSLTPAIATSVTKSGPGTLILDAANTFSSSLNVNEGTVVAANVQAIGTATLEVAAGATFAVSPLIGAANPVQLTALGDIAGTIELDTGRFSLPAADESPEAQLRDLLISGRNGGGWNGTAGIVSSEAAGSAGTRAIGYAVGNDGSAVVAFAAPGDGDLSGQVNVFDLLEIDSAGKFGNGQPSDWSQGDFNYDGVTNVFDLLAIDTAGAYGEGSYLPPAAISATVTAVPEPSTYCMALAGLACGGYTMFRRRKQA